MNLHESYCYYLTVSNVSNNPLHRHFENAKKSLFYQYIAAHSPHPLPHLAHPLFPPLPIFCSPQVRSFVRPLARSLVQQKERDDGCFAGSATRVGQNGNSVDLFNISSQSIILLTTAKYSLFEGSSIVCALISINKRV